MNIAHFEAHKNSMCNVTTLIKKCNKGSNKQQQPLKLYFNDLDESSKFFDLDQTIKKDMDNNKKIL